jgi:hypothetical protein
MLNTIRENSSRNVAAGRAKDRPDVIGQERVTAVAGASELVQTEDRQRRHEMTPLSAPRPVEPLYEQDILARDL